MTDTRVDQAAAITRLRSPRAGVVMSAERWESIQNLLHEALCRSPDERGAWLAAACPSDDVRREVEDLLAAHERPGKLDQLASALFEPLLATRHPPTGPAIPVLSRYRIVERLGGGGMGVVYRASDARLGRDVALKFLPPHLSADEAAKKRFMVEARAAAALEHPNICTIHEIGETEDGQLYIVMGCYDGETVDRAIARGPLLVSDALRIAGDVARGLAKAHDRGIVHRDVKPANIMLTSDGDVKILDFGIAKLADVNFTQTGGIIGTVAYMSPEQAFGESVDHRTDIWSLGVVLYEMVTGVRPFQAPGEQGLLFSILTQEPAPIASLGREAPAGLDAIVARSLAKRPVDRFSSTQELLAALAALPPLGAALPRAATAALPAGTARTDSLLTHAGERRQAAVVSTGIAGYAALVERLAPDDIDRLAAAVRDAATDAATRHGGIVNHFAADDAVMLFGVAAAHEDDFLRAVRATLHLHARVRSLTASTADRSGVDIRMRSGIHTGLVVAQRERSGDRRFRITGSPLDLAARLSALAESDAILISPDCHRVVSPFIDATACPQVALQADAPPVAPWRVLAESQVHTRLEFAERTGLTPYAGRSRELAALEDQLAAAGRGAGGIAIVIGEAGSGKSRLLHELRRYADESSAHLLTGRCDAYGGTTPYLPFVQVLRDLLGLAATDHQGSTHDEVIARVRAIDESLVGFLPLYLTLLSVPDELRLGRHLSGEQLQTAMPEGIAALVTLYSRHRPTVIVLEDWHWADEASRTALDQLGEIVPAHPVLIVVSCRPDAGVAWTSGEHRTLIHLGPLDIDASREIMRAVLGVRDVRSDLATQLHERTGGNPFFLEETCEALHEENAVDVRDGEAVAVGAFGSVQLPETVQAVIRTRLDRLDPEARDALRVASVIGREFARGVLDETSPQPSDLTSALERLRRSGLIQQTCIVPEPVYHFKHVLTQEVAYDTLLEHQRKTLHRAAGRAIERRYADRLDEHLERLAHHFSRAEEWRDAIAYGIRAADRASALSQLADALATLDRIELWLPRLGDADERRECTTDVLLRQERLCETLGLRQRQLRIAEELITLLAPLGPSPKLAEAYLRQGDVCTLLRRFDAADRALATALRMSRERADRAAERNVLRSIGLLRSHEGRHTDAIVTFEQALGIDRELGDAPAAAGELASLGNILRKVGRPEEGLRALEQALDGLGSEANWMKRSAVKVVMAAAHRDLGDVDGALRHLDGLAADAIERRNPIQASFALLQIANVHLQQGRIQESLQTYRQAVDLTRKGGHTEGLVQSLRDVGEVLFGLGQHAEALLPLREAAGLFEQLEDREAQALMWSRIATAHERCAQPAEAHAAWDSVRTLAARAGDLESEAAALEGIARTARQQGMRTDAALRYEEALARAVETGDRRRELSLRNTLGILCWEEGRYQEALRQYEAALRLCRALGDRVHEGLVLNSLGATLLRLRRYDEALTVVEDAAQLNAETGERGLEAHSLALLGDVLLAIGRRPEARRRVEASLAIRREICDRLGEGWMLERLARIHGADEREDDAAAALDAALAVARETGDPALSAALTQVGEPHRGEPVEQR